MTAGPRPKASAHETGSLQPGRRVSPLQQNHKHHETRADPRALQREVHTLNNCDVSKNNSDGTGAHRYTSAGNGEGNFLEKTEVMASPTSQLRNQRPGEPPGLPFSACLQ
ncbi:hypothetical protein LEMLEM_LOCUS6356 [Lemmus lemmus]